MIVRKVLLAEKEGFYTCPDSNRLTLILKELSIPACDFASVIGIPQDGVRYANEPTFHTRVQPLLSRINPEALTKLVGDPIVFERKLRQTRNHFTHAGIPKKKDVLTDGKQLFLFNQKLHVLLRLLMLKSIGFSDDAVFEQMFQQSRRYN